MTSRYPLRNPSSGRPSVRRLSPTAVRNTGPLQRPRAATGTGNARTEGAGIELHFEPDASTSPAAGTPYPETEVLSVWTDTIDILPDTSGVVPISRKVTEGE
ncbi:hypothetical protein C0992_003206 [Termitomyces sp. T32_za158]|nr:hypothetical protein C0992_003206 [Termitomyces sp. T32_za158]